MRAASQRIRPPAVAGMFYPRDPSELRRMTGEYLRDARPEAGSTPKAIIAPHAGYIYSGPIAASAYARLSPARDFVRRVILIGPAHRVAVRGLAATSDEFWATPLGDVRVDQEAVRQIQSLPQVCVMDEAHAQEHSLEVHLPFLQVVLADFKIVPLVVGSANYQEVAEVIEALWGGDETRFVISSDLSHYHDHASARGLDAATAEAIESLRPEDIAETQACGRTPICGLLQTARRRGLRARTVDLRNSGDTAGPRNKVVGYGAWVFEGGAAPA